MRLVVVVLGLWRWEVAGTAELAIPGAAVGRLCDSSECGKLECSVPDCALLYAREACNALHRAFVS